MISDGYIFLSISSYSIYHLFPTTLCGVLVFDSVSRVLRPPPPAARLSHTTHCGTHTIFHTHTTLSHTIFVNNLVTHHLSTPSFTIFVNHLCPPPSFTIFVNHPLSHTIFVNHLSHTIFQPPSLSTTIFHTPSFTQHVSHTIFHTPSFTHHLCQPSLSTTIFHTPSFTISHTHLPHTPSLTALCVALGDIHLRFAWQAWHLWHWAGSGGALGLHWSPVTPRHFAWQAWHLATSTLVSRGRRGTWSHPPSFCVAGVALMALGWLWWRAWTALVAGDAAALCVAGVALGDIYLGFAWQAWHLVTSTFFLRGRRGTYGTGLALVVRLDCIGRR